MMGLYMVIWDYIWDINYMGLSDIYIYIYYGIYIYITYYGIYIYIYMMEYIYIWYIS